MSTRPIGIDELREIAERLPRQPLGPYFRVPRMGHPEFRYYRPHPHPHTMEETISYVEFTARGVEIKGVPATAWFYHDLLVKVTV